jgi:hypothetical protein
VNIIGRYFFKILITVWILASFAFCAETKSILLHWDFNSISQNQVLEEISGKRDAIDGNYLVIPGPSGNAIRFDGYTTRVRRAAVPELTSGKPVTVTCWIYLDAYPWAQLPIANQDDAHGIFFFGLNETGHLQMVAADEAEATVSKTLEVLPLKTWLFLAVALDTKRTIALSINGKSADANTTTVNLPAAEKPRTPPNDLIVGHVRSPQLPEPSEMLHPKFPVEYSLEGSLAEFTIERGALPPAELQRRYEAQKAKIPSGNSFPPLPRWSGGPAPFGAFYTTLTYDPIWDNFRRTAPNSDVVVRFGNSPIQLVFWQGANYIPAWVTENNRWYTDEFVETYAFSRCPEGGDCEPMSDKQVRYSRVRILESTPARAVIHWRYALNEVEHYNIADAKSPTDWGAWADEYWTVYPDGVAVRKQVAWSTAPDRDKTEFQESIVLIPAGEKPEDSVDLDAITLANLKGESRVYHWQQKTVEGFSTPNGPNVFPEPASAVIQWVNLKSQWKPFQVAWGGPVSYEGYNGEKSLSSFEWWNHWPVAQITSSGRVALGADRPSHTSLSHIFWPVYQQDQQSVSKILLDGLTMHSAAELAALAASWRSPALIDATGAQDAHYDPAQRAYVLSANSRETRITLHGSPESPVMNPALVIENWTGDAVVSSDLGASEKIKSGFVDELGGRRLIVFLEVSSANDVKITVRGK